MSMNPEVKAKWVAALRSGEYKQGREQLKYGNEFCCLGVLCDLYAKEHEVEFDDGLADYGSELPSDTVCEWAGLPKNNPEVQVDGYLHEVSVHNDGTVVEGKTFAQIADAIEAQL